MNGVWDELRISLASASSTPDAPFCPVLRRMADEGRLGVEGETESIQGGVQRWFHCTQPSIEDLIPLVDHPTKHIFMELFHEGQIVFAFKGNRIFWRAGKMYIPEREPDGTETPSFAFKPN